MRKTTLVKSVAGLGVMAHKKIIIAPLLSGGVRLCLWVFGVGVQRGWVCERQAQRRTCKAPGFTMLVGVPLM